MKSSLEIKGAEFDSSGFVANLEKVLDDALVTTVKAAVETTANAVPVETGMARASLLPAARAVRAAINISPKRNRQREGKTVSAGFNKGDYQVLKGKATRSAIIKSSVLHYVVNETFNNGAVRVQLPRPWRSMLKGEVAGRRALDAFPLADRLQLKSFFRNTLERR